MNRYVMHYKHTEYRTLTVEAGSEDEAHTMWLQGDGADEYVCSGGDFELIGINMIHNDTQMESEPH